MAKNILYRLRQVLRKLRKCRDILTAWKYLSFPLGKKYYVMGTPNHTNIGDSAIALAEMSFIKKNTKDIPAIKELSFSDVKRYSRLLTLSEIQNCHFYWHGGGNMGDQWFAEESLRQEFIIKRINSNLVIFPQTIFYSDTEDGNKKLKDSISIYNNSNLILVAREKQSFSIMKEHYPNAHILLTPDIVLSSTMEDFGAVPAERSGILFVTRSDPEKSVSDETWERLHQALVTIGKDIRKTDMYSDTPVTKENRAACVRKKMQEFCGAELVITDRLHGMVFAALTATPCIVFSNYNHKVKGTYDWISYLPYIRYCETAEEAEAAIPELLAMKDCHFDNTPLLPYFEPLAEVIKKYAAN